MSLTDKNNSSPAHMPHKILMLNETDESGGAARAAIRLAVGLRHRGADLQMAVQRKDSDRHWIVRGESHTQKALARVLGRIDRLPNALYPNRSQAEWSNNWLPNDIGKVFDFARYDLLHLNWMGGGFLPMRTLARIGLPVVWTLHDMWSFTGGCHYGEGCRGFEKSCGHCPQLGSRAANDLSARNLRAKQRAYRGKKVFVVSPSRWLAEEAHKSSLFHPLDIRVIPYGIDLTVFRPIDSRTARDLFALPQDKRIVLFGAVNATSNERKGYSLLCSALAEMTKNGARTDDLLLVVFGSSELRNPPQLGIPVRFMGKLSDDVSLACLYSSADVMVLPSRQENLANAVIEAMACGTPTVAFDIGGNGDMVDHQQTGYLAKPFETCEMAQGISWVLGDAARLTKLSEAARRKCERIYDLNVVCSQYETLYRTAVDGV